MLGSLPRQGRCWGFAPQLRCGLVLAIVPCALRPGHRHLRPLARRAFAAGSPSARWADLATSTSEATMTEALVEEAMTRFGRKQRKGVYLYQILAVAFSLPTQNAGRTAIKRGEVCVDGERVASSNAALPEIGSVMTLRTTSDKVPEDIDRRLTAWNFLRRSRAEAQIRLLYEDPEVGWGVVNKPAGLDSSPWDESRSKGRFTFQAYLPAVIGPPTKGVPCRGPRVCHRLDFRVGGPLVVATSEEAIRNLMFCFAEQLVEKEYRAIVCGKVEEEGASFTIDWPVDGKAACTDIQVLKVAKCPHHGHLTELALSPRQGRYRQLRRHCAEVLGAPIVNEDAGVVFAAAEAWRLQGKALPSALVKPVGRGKGNLFLQKLRVSLPPPEDLKSSERVTIAVPPSDRFDLLMDASARAFEYGWRTDEHGETKLLEDAGA